MRPSRWKYAFYLLLLLALTLVLFRLFAQKEDETYITEPARIGDIEKVVNATGEVRAAQLVTVGAQVSGKIEKIYVSVGQKVKEGELIAQIESTTQENDVDMYKARLNSYKAQLEAAQTTLKVAQKQYQRTEKLYQQKAASAEELENAEDTFHSGKSRVAELQAALKETEISLSTAQKNLGYTKITAPLDGTIVSVPVKTGQTINANMNTPTIVQIADLNRMEILIEISEGDIGQVKAGAKVTYSTLSDLDKTYETTLKSIDPALTLLTNGEYSEVVASGEAIYYYGRLDVPNENDVLRIGMTVQNVIYVENAKDVLIIPATAIKTDGQDKYVEILSSDNAVERRTVKTGVSDGLNIEIKEGLKEGDLVIIARLSSSEISDKTSNIRRGPRGF